MAKRQKKWFSLNVAYLSNVYDGTLVKSEILYMYAYDITAAKRTLGKEYQIISYSVVDANSQTIEALNKCKANAEQVD